MYYPRPFRLNQYLAQFDPRLLADSEGRRILTRLDPILFALTYVPHHLKGPETGDEITFSEFHVDLAEYARELVKPIGREPAERRDAFVAPRGVGKSTWLFLIIPLWLAAHGHRKFLAAFANAATQAEDHLRTFKNEIENNQLLRNDFPELCNPARRPKGTTVSDSQSMYIAKSGFVFVAKGIDSSNLGLKINERRPDHLVLDDVEGTEGNYSETQKNHRLATLLAGILPLNVFASVTMAGTVSIPGSIIDDIAAKQRGEEYPDWVDDENFTPRYYPAIVTDQETGEERSLWPEKWPITWLISVRHTRQFRSQMMNDPMAYDGEYWNDDEFVYEDIPVTHQILSIDPAVTSKTKSDYTALVVVGFNRLMQKCVIRYAVALKIQPGKALKERIEKILNAYPDTAGVIVETNQGGDTWLAILDDLPCPVRTVSQSEAKEIRAGSLLAKYQRGKVVHAKKLPALEKQMVAFPKGANDDLVDACGTGVTVFLKDDRKPPKSEPKSVSYA